MFSQLVFAGPAASIADLAWMTGSWAITLGSDTLEENWIAPTGSSIAAMVRMSSNDGTGKCEVIAIEKNLLAGNEHSTAGELVLSRFRRRHKNWSQAL